MCLSTYTLGTALYNTTMYVHEPCPLIKLSERKCIVHVHNSYSHAHVAVHALVLKANRHLSGSDFCLGGPIRHWVSHKPDPHNSLQLLQAKYVEGRGRV